MENLSPCLSFSASALLSYLLLHLKRAYQVKRNVDLVFIFWGAIASK
jgi:hypothetical protein